MPARHQFTSNGSIKDIISSLKIYRQNRLPAQSLLIQDIHEILNLFQNISKANTFKLSLESISTDMCRKFHADIISSGCFARMLVRAHYGYRMIQKKMVF